MEEVRKFLGVERIHAAELGMGRLASIAKGLGLLHKSLDLKFDFYMVYKKDHAAICFFDQVFDQGINPAVPWLAYWTPLRYILLHKVSSLFDLELLKRSWNARIQTNDEIAETELVEVCKTLLYSRWSCSRRAFAPNNHRHAHVGFAQSAGNPIQRKKQARIPLDHTKPDWIPDGDSRHRTAYNRWHAKVAGHHR